MQRYLALVNFCIDPPTFFIVKDPAGLRIETQLIWVDIVEAITWLLILATIEVTVYLQDRGIVKGLLLKTVNNAKFLLYSILWCAIFCWIYRGHYMLLGMILCGLLALSLLR